MQALGARLRELAERSVVALKFCCFMDVFSNHVIQIQQCMGPSMLPTFNIAGDILVVEHWSVDFSRVKAGDVVMSLSPLDPRLTVCKRVLGLEGDFISYSKGNGPPQRIQVPRGHVWLQGDNPSMSRDSREYGPVPYAMLKGRVIFRVWPPKGWGRVPSSLPTTV